MDASGLCEALYSPAEERRGGCGGDLRGGDAAHDAVCRRALAGEPGGVDAAQDAGDAGLATHAIAERLAWALGRSRRGAQARNGEVERLQADRRSRRRTRKACERSVWPAAARLALIDPATRRIDVEVRLGPTQLKGLVMTGNRSMARRPGRLRQRMFESSVASSSFGQRLNKACSAHLPSIRASW